MEHHAKRFVARILAFHLLLLGMVIATVYLASREIYQSARYQAIEQAKRRQELLAGQTALGLEGFYNSILSALDLLRRSAGERIDDEATLTAALWEQLDGPVSHLFLLDKTTLAVQQRFSQDTGSLDLDINAAAEWLRTVEEPAVSPFQIGADKGEGSTLICVPIQKSGTVTQLALAVVPMRVPPDHRPL